MNIICSNYNLIKKPKSYQKILNFPEYNSLSCFSFPLAFYIFSNYIFTSKNILDLIPVQ